MSLEQLNNDVALSEQRTKINAAIASIGGVSVVDEAGQPVAYWPAADTDTDRATALSAACSAATSGSTIHFTGGTYDFGTTGLSVDKDLSLVGHGRPILKTYLPNGSNKEGYKFGPFKTVNLEGIQFRTDMRQSDYGSGNFYNVTMTDHGTTKNCDFVFNITATAVDGGTSGKNVVNLGEYNHRYENCTFHTITTATVPCNHMACHSDSGGDSGSLYKTLKNCVLLGENTTEIFTAGGPARLIRCVTNTPNNLNVPMVNFYEATALAPASSTIQEAYYNKYITHNNNGEYEVSVKTDAGSTWHTVFQIEEAADNGANFNYEVEVSLSYLLDGLGTIYQYYYHALHNHNGTQHVIAERDEAPLGGHIQWVLTSGSGTDEFQFLERSTGPNQLYGTVKFRPVRRGEGVLTAGTDQQYSEQIRFFDISE